ncbi:MAG: exo-alpha-sialidase [Kiritimatiellae bacterium]|nr:exo-alpha-sialidase [Kiritimatiellia bacterium]
MRRLIAIFAALAGFLCTFAEPAPGVTTVLELKPGPGNPRNSEGAFLSLKDGRIMFAYSRYCGTSSHDHAQADIAVRYSSDNGTTWTQTDEILVKNHGGMNVMSVSLLRLQSGEIALFYLLKNSEQDCRPVMRRSFDEGKTWSDGTLCITDEIAYYVLNNDRVIQLKDGRLLFAVSKHTSDDGKFDKLGTVLTYSSDDNGKTWQRGKSAFQIVAPSGKRYAAHEPGVVECSDGSVLLWIRTGADFQYFSRSTDRGETWSAPQPSQLRSPLSPASIKRLPTGELLAIWNDHEAKPEMRTHHPDKHKWANGWRSPLSAAISRDDGRTWHGSKMIEDDPEGWFCYTAIQPLDDGTVLLAYCAYDVLAHSRLVKVPLEWFGVVAPSVVEHAALSRRAAADGMVLLKNNGALPLEKGATLALFGASGALKPGGGGSSGVNSLRTVSLRSGLANAGFKLDKDSRDTALFVVLRDALEGEDSPDDAFELTKAELEEFASIKAAGFKHIVVLCGGGHVFNIKPFADDDAVDAILWTWYAGGEGALAIGDVLSGAVNPSGRLAETFAECVGDYPTDRGWRESRWYVPYEEGIFVGYRYFETIPGAASKVVYPFGHGLSYTSWQVSPVECTRSPSGSFDCKVRVKNTGRTAGRHSVLCWTSQSGGAAEHPAFELRAFAKTRLLAPGEEAELALSFQLSDLAYFEDDETSPFCGSWMLDKGGYSVYIGGAPRDAERVASFDIPAPEVLSSPGLKLQADRLARRLKADGTFKTLHTSYPGHVERPEHPQVRTNITDRVDVTLFDVAEGKASLDELLDGMALQEMLHLLFGHLREDPCGTGSIGALEKFGIPAMQTCDGPAGVRREAPSSFFPCAALLACTFDAPLIREIGAAIGDEAAEAGFDLLLAPGLCIHRHPLCGRNFEYFSEDPLVSGIAAAAYVEGVQSCGVGATLKHFAGNGRETTRRIQKDVVSERAFREIYLRGFERAVKAASPWAIMTSYNGVNGYNSGENYGLVTGILRDEWGYQGVAMTDWLTTIPMWREIGAGNDLKMPKDIEDTNRNIQKRGDAVAEALFAYNRDYLSLTRIRESAKRICELVMKSRRFGKEAKTHR